MTSPLPPSHSLSPETTFHISASLLCLPPSLVLLLLLLSQQIPFSFHLFTHGCFRVPLRNALGIITKHVLWIHGDSSHNGDNQGCMNGDVNEWRSLALQIKWVDTRLFWMLVPIGGLVVTHPTVPALKY